MNPAIWVALISGLAAIVGGGLTLHSTRLTLRNQATANSNANQIATVQTQIEGWDKFADRQGQEIERLTHSLAEERAIAEAFSAARDRLEQENRTLRAERDACPLHHQPDPMTEGTTPT